MLTSWSGWDLRHKTSDVTPDVFASYALHGSSHSECYELLAVTARGFRPPQYLTSSDLPYEDETEFDSQVVELAELRETWTLLYRRVAETQPRVIEPYGIYLLGVNPPRNTSPEEIEAFNDFYTNIHLPEVAERRHALRAVRYELVREIKTPYQGAPTFLATYEVDEESASNRRHIGPPYSTGPAVWQGHTTPWRLWYRRFAF